MVEAGTVVQALEDYANRTTQVIQQNRAELQAMVGMLAKTVESVASESSASVSRLQQIEEQLTAATEIEDVRLLRAKLADCLTSIQEETAKRREQQEQALQALREQKKCADEVGERYSDSNRDVVTGLGDRASAETEINEAIREQRKFYAAVLVLDRLQSYNAAFGHAVGDNVLKHFAEFIGSRVRPGCQLYRWTGPAFLLLIERASRAETVREELSALMAQNCEHHVQTATRSIHLPVKCRWTLLPMMLAPRLLMQRVDNFIASPQNADF
jgi:diguanylate cyclase (GGDEF)-like protein